MHSTPLSSAAYQPPPHLRSVSTSGVPSSSSSSRPFGSYSSAHSPFESVERKEASPLPYSASYSSSTRAQTPSYSASSAAAPSFPQGGAPGGPFLASSPPPPIPSVARGVSGDLLQRRAARDFDALYDEHNADAPWQMHRNKL